VIRSIRFGGVAKLKDRPGPEEILSREPRARQPEVHLDVQHSTGIFLGDLEEEIDVGREAWIAVERDDTPSHDQVAIIMRI
jgi:hypothetical protein